MKAFTAIARLIVGSLFIVSGLIKCNDATGFSYKLNDYFAHDVLNVEFLIPYSLGLAVLICVVEIVLGVALIFGFKSKLTTTSILLMMLFFTWLTWYTSSCLQEQEVAAKLGEEFSKNCVTDCGCFGDALKLEPIESFYKDLFLLIFAIPLFFASFKKMIPVNKPKQDIIYMTISILLIIGFGAFVIGWWFTVLFSLVLYAIVYFIKNKTKNQWIPLIVSFVISLGFTWYCLENLPLKDFRAYKLDDNLIENMSIPEDAPKPIIDYHWKFMVNGEEQIVTTQGDYPTVDGEYVSVETETVDEGYEPSILDFSIETTEENFTDHFLAKDNLIMIISYNLDKFNLDSVDALKTFTDDAIKNGYTVIGLSSSDNELKKAFNAKHNLNFDWYLCDEKALKTVIRSNPGILESQKGTVSQKLHWKNLGDFKMKSLPNANPDLNLFLKRQLDSVMVLDQKYRANYDPEKWQLQEMIDSSNTAFIETVFKTFGYPGKSLVGESTQSVAWYVIQHSNKIPEYLPLMKEAAQKGELPMSNVAMMEDRYLMGKGEMQIYGTQGSSYAIGTPQELSFIWPIENPEEVNKRRKEVGFDETIEVYSKRMFGEDFEYKPLTLEEKDKLLEAFKN